MLFFHVLLDKVCVFVIVIVAICSLKYYPCIFFLWYVGLEVFILFNFITSVVLFPSQSLTIIFLPKSNLVKKFWNL